MSLQHRMQIELGFSNLRTSSKVVRVGRWPLHLQAVDKRHAQAEILSIMKLQLLMIERDEGSQLRSAGHDPVGPGSGRKAADVGSCSLFSKRRLLLDASSRHVNRFKVIVRFKT